MTTAAQSIGLIFNTPVPQFPSFHDVGTALNIGALKLKMPMHTVVNQAIRCFTNIHEGECGNADSKIAEVVKRVGIFCCCLVGSAPALPLHIIGIGVDVIGDKLTKKSYTELKGNPQAPNTSPERHFFSLNANMFWIDGAFGGTRPASERIPELSKKINFHTDDVVVLQEMSFGNARALWNSGMKEHYSVAITRVFPSPLTDFDANLFIALKEPLVSAICEDWESADAFKRGMLCVETEHYYVINAHLQSKGEPEHVKIRAVHAQKLRDAVERLERTGKEVLVFIDGNMCRTKQEFQEHIKPYFYDPFQVTDENATCTDKLDEYMMGAKSTLPKEWIDCVLTTFDTKEKVDIQLQQIKTFDLNEPDKALSDHTAFRTTVQFKKLMSREREDQLDGDIKESKKDQ